MMWLWTGEVSADGQGYRVLASGQKGIMHPLTGIAKEVPRHHAPATLRDELPTGRCTRSTARSTLLPVMPLILAVDTTGEHGSIALLRGGEVIGRSRAARARRLQRRFSTGNWSACWRGTP